MSQIEIKNERGEQIKLTSYQKNALYKQAKDLERKIAPSLSSRKEMRSGSDRDVNKHIQQEQSTSNDQTKYRKIMRAIDSDPKDRNLERFRR